MAVLRVPESANPGWTAELDGASLEPLRIDGWQQGWIVPAGDGGTVVLAYAPTSTQQLGLGLGAAAGLVGLLLGLVRGRRDSPGSWDSRPVAGLRRGIPAAAGLVTGGALLGPAGLVAGAAAGVLGRRGTGVVVAGSALLMAAAAAAVRAPVLLTSALALGGALVAIVSALRRPGR
jgi:arabinofuranan 3-O-arabinosyltransferase